MSREDGVLHVALHTGGGSFAFDETTHHDLGAAFDQIGADPGNRVIILTGTGDRFCADFDYGSFSDAMRPDRDAFWIRLRHDGDRMLRSFADIEVPVIAAINGPVVTHSELPLLADVVLAADATVFRDATHVVAGIPPGDGMQIIWTELIGLNRARYFLMTGQTLTAQEAHRLGVIAEVLAAGRLQQRARELARVWAALPAQTLRGTRAVLNRRWRKLLADDLHSGLTYEALADLSHPESATRGGTVNLLAGP
jgi:enoyl-CoA hydratase/carnithine racemase